MSIHISIQTLAVCCKGFCKHHTKNILKKRKKDLAQNLYFIDLKNEPNAKNIMQVSAKFFFTFSLLPGTIDHLPIIPTGETPSFVKRSDIISHS